jgi:hypothetical protein
VYDFDWLFEGLTTVYLLLGTAFLGLVVIYWHWRRKVWFFAMLVVAALIGLYALLDRLVETDSEQIERKLEAMARGVRDHNVDAVFEHLADDFRSPGGNSKADFRKEAEPRIGSVSRLAIWNYRYDSKPERGKEFTGLRFRFKVVPSGLQADPWCDCRPLLVYDAEKGWQVKGFTVLKPDTTEPIYIPF